MEEVGAKLPETSAEMTLRAGISVPLPEVRGTLQRKLKRIKSCWSRRPATEILTGNPRRN